MCLETNIYWRIDSFATSSVLSFLTTAGRHHHRRRKVYQWMGGVGWGTAALEKGGLQCGRHALSLHPSNRHREERHSFKQRPPTAIYHHHRHQSDIIRSTSSQLLLLLLLLPESVQWMTEKSLNIGQIGNRRLNFHYNFLQYVPQLSRTGHPVFSSPEFWCPLTVAFVGLYDFMRTFDRWTAACELWMIIKIVLCRISWTIPSNLLMCQGFVNQSEFRVKQDVLDRRRLPGARTISSCLPRALEGQDQDRRDV